MLLTPWTFAAFFVLVLILALSWRAFDLRRDEALYELEQERLRDYFDSGIC